MATVNLTVEMDNDALKSSADTLTDWVYELVDMVNAEHYVSAVDVRED